MTPKDLSQIESALDVNLPEKVRRFLLDHADELNAARKTLDDEVVLETRPAAIVKLNRSLRKHGIEDARPTPWPTEYLALSDNGAGDHDCVKLTEKTGAIHEFNGEEGRFSRKFPSPGAYLAGLRKRLAKFQKSAKGKSDPKLLKRSPGLFADGKYFSVAVSDVAPPVTAAELRAAGVDTDRLLAEYAALLEAVTAVPRRSWAISLRKGEYPNQVRLAYSTTARQTKPFAFGGFQIVDGHMKLSVQAADPKSTLDVSMVEWPAFNQALGNLFATVMRTPVRVAPRKVSVSKPTVYGWASFTYAYAMLPG